jgi:hypothetical protein
LLNSSPAEAALAIAGLGAERKLTSGGGRRTRAWSMATEIDLTWSNLSVPPGGDRQFPANTLVQQPRGIALDMPAADSQSLMLTVGTRILHDGQVTVRRS